MSADASRPRPVALVIDDEEGVRESFRVIFEGEFEVLEADQGVKGLEVLRSRRVDVVLLDVRMPGPPGPTFLPQILALDDRIAVIIVTAVKDVRTAVEAIKGGAYDYVTKPFDVDEILALVRQAAERRALEREVHYLRAELDRAQGFDALVGRHPSMVRLYELIAQVAQTPATVLIAAESGTGKELVAHAIHRQGPRRAQPLVAVNLAAIPDTLLESELFGHEKGAFTGAHARKMGKFELAHGGTLFLDEVGTLRVDLQAKLLRALQEREIERLGGGRTIPVDVRIIAATNVDLKAAVRARTFREDLAIHEVNQRAGGDGGQAALPLHEARDRFEQAYVLRALERENWNRSRAARLLGIHRNTLLARLAVWGVRSDEIVRPLPPAAGGSLP